jgi:hypothetical protein
LFNIAAEVLVLLVRRAQDGGQTICLVVDLLDDGISITSYDDDVIFMFEYVQKVRETYNYFMYF